MKRNLAAAMATMLVLSAFAGCNDPSTAPGGSVFDMGKSISVVSREDGSGTRGAFIELVGIEVKSDDGTKKDMTTKEAIIADKTDIMMTNIASDPYAIGYISLGSLSDSIKALDIDGVEATVKNVKNGTYKIQRPFNIATKGEAAGTVKDFIDFIMSKEGQAVVSANHYITIDEQAPAYAGNGPAGKVVIAGSSSVTPVMEKLKEAYLDVNSGASIEIQMSDSTAGMAAAIDRICDIGMASRELKDSEKAELTYIAIALDGIAVVINNQNPLTSLTSEQVRSIFAGEATKWSDVQ